MKRLFMIIAALVFIGTGAFAQTSLSETIASGKKVFVQIVNDADHPIPEDEQADVVRCVAEAGQWTVAESADAADFIVSVQCRKKVVFNSPRTWLTPSVLDKEGNVLWQGKQFKADATTFNGFKATNRCINKMIEYGFQKDLFVKAGRN
ncbi:MAG: hypothetical protein J6W86_00350 [Bacteroidales bacterium]|nr:hypothetical protein [Bacteroidales bacterium]